MYNKFNYFTMEKNNKHSSLDHLCSKTEDSSVIHFLLFLHNITSYDNNIRIY